MPHVPQALFVVHEAPHPLHVHCLARGGAMPEAWPIQCQRPSGSFFHSAECPEDHDGELHDPAPWPPPARPEPLHAGMGAAQAPEETEARSHTLVRLGWGVDLQSTQGPLPSGICMYIYIYMYISATVPRSTKWSVLRLSRVLCSLFSVLLDSNILGAGAPLTHNPGTVAGWAEGHYIRRPLLIYHRGARRVRLQVKV